MHSEQHGTPEALPSVVALPGVDRHVRTQRHRTSGGRNPFVGPLSAPLWEKAHSVPSTYPDTFDYGMYDRLYERFGDQQPRGGVVYNPTASFNLLPCPSCPWGRCHFALVPHSDALPSSVAPSWLPRRRTAPSRAPRAG